VLIIRTASENSVPIRIAKSVTPVTTAELHFEASISTVTEPLSVKVVYDQYFKVPPLAIYRFDERQKGINS